MFFLTEFVATPTMKFRINHSTKLLEFGAEIHQTFYEPFTTILNVGVPYQERNVIMCQVNIFVSYKVDLKFFLKKFGEFQPS